MLLIKNITQFLKVLADENRLKIISLLSRQEMAVCELLEVLNLSQPAVSHHLKLLKQAGLIQDTKEGKWVFYNVNQENLMHNVDSLNNYFEVIQQQIGTGVKSSPIRVEPCLCDEIKAKTRHTLVVDEQ